MSADDAYQNLLSRWREVTLLGACRSVLSWDEQTYMPPGGAEARGHQLALLAGLRHEKLTDSAIGALLACLEGSELVADPLSAPAVNVREIRWTYDRATKLPKSLVEELARTTSRAQHEWVKARSERSFAVFRPWLEKVMALKRQEADALGFEQHPYDALMDEYDPGTRVKDVSVLFAKLREELVPLVAAIGDAPHKPDESIVARYYPVEKQRYFGEQAAAAIGFDFRRGRLDKTTHPFCSTLGSGDCRITTRYNPRHFNESFFGILHESGHAIYEQGLDPAHYGSPMGEAVSLGIHESQSRLWENEVGRSLSFWRYFFPQAKRIFREALGDVELEQFHFAINAVKRSFIRVEADEVTYNLHILIRFELEQDLLTGDLPVGDVPAAWNERYRRYLDITPAHDGEGCLQDIHWSAGLVGYFPTYTLGNLYGAQLYRHAAAELGGLDEEFARGEFGRLKDWLTEKVYRHGRRYRSADLIRAATGTEPSSKALVDFLRARFGGLYGI